ncbi:uncharacterized [Tachysurus ichikawai]
MGESKEESNRQLMSVWLIHAKHNTDYTGYMWCRDHFGSLDQRIGRSPWLRDGSPASPISSPGFPRDRCLQIRRARA